MDPRSAAGGHQGPAAAHFFEEIAGRVKLPGHVSAADAASAVLCAFTQRLSGGEAQAILERLPRSLRPLFELCVRHRGERCQVFGRAGFLERVASHLGVEEEAADAIVRAVLAAVRARLSSREVHDAASQLPRDLAGYWPPPTGNGLEVLARVERTARLPPGVSPGAAIVAVMCPLLRRLTGGEAQDLVRALPDRVRALVQPCALHGERPVERFDRAQLVRRVAQRLQTSEAVAEQATRAVFAAIQGAAGRKQTGQVASQLPRDLQAFWREASGLASEQWAGA